MPDKEGILRMQPNRRWAIHRPGSEPIEITSVERFRVEVDGAEDLQLTRMGLFEPSTEIIRKGKAAKPDEFGKMVKLQGRKTRSSPATRSTTSEPADPSHRGAPDHVGAHAPSGGG